MPRKCHEFETDQLARLLFADFDVSVRHVVAQPFLLKAEVAGATRKQILDYLLLTDPPNSASRVRRRFRCRPGQAPVRAFAG
jgi:hypothetical protein